MYPVGDIEGCIRERNLFVQARACNFFQGVVDVAVACSGQWSAAIDARRAQYEYAYARVWSFTWSLHWSMTCAYVQKIFLIQPNGNDLSTQFQVPFLRDQDGCRLVAFLCQAMMYFVHISYPKLPGKRAYRSVCHYWTKLRCCETLQTSACISSSPSLVPCANAPLVPLV